jgi:hypothetical protein
VEHLHLYQINGRIRLGEAEPIRSEPKQEYQTILCETENWRESTMDKGKRGINEHDKKMQYFPHGYLLFFMVPNFYPTIDLAGA